MSEFETDSVIATGGTASIDDDELIVANNVEAEAEVVMDDGAVDGEEKIGDAGVTDERSASDDSDSSSDSSSSSSSSDSSSSGSSSDGSDGEEEFEEQSKNDNTNIDPSSTGEQQPEEDDDEDEEQEINENPVRSEPSAQPYEPLDLKMEQQQQQPTPKQQQPQQQSSSKRANSSEKATPRNTIPATMLQMANLFDDPDAIEQNCDENGVYKWEDFIGAKVRIFSPEEYRNFQVPLQQGWKRELVIRCTGSRADKKLGDVYYHTPDGFTKIRSYVEMTQFLKKNPEIVLTLANFSYAKQPIYRPPNEIVRHAMQRGSNHSGERFASIRSVRQQRPPPTELISPPIEFDGSGPSTSILSGNEDSNDPEMSQNGGILGRGKRKRVMPSRYEDNNIDLIPVKKGKIPNGQQPQQENPRQINRESYSNGNSNDEHSPPTNNNKCSTVSTSKMTAQERRIVLQRQLYQQINEEMKREEERAKAAAAAAAAQAAAQDPSGNQENGTTPKVPKMKIGKLSSGNKKSESKRPGNSMNCEGQSMLMKPEEMMENDQNNDDSIANGTGGDETGTIRQPCSTNCPGRRNMLPNLMCYRCFCLFHLDCVPDGVFLKDPKVFTCPNCLTQEDRLNAEGSTPQPVTKSETVPSKPCSKSRNNQQVPMENSIPPVQGSSISDPNSLLAKHHVVPATAGTSQKLLAAKKAKKRQQNKMAESLLNGNMQNGFSMKSKASSSSDVKLPTSMKTNGVPPSFLYKSSLSRRIVPPHPSMQLQNRRSFSPQPPSSPSASSNSLNFFPINFQPHSNGHHQEPMVNKYKNHKKPSATLASSSSLMMNGFNRNGVSDIGGKNNIRYKNNQITENIIDKRTNLVKNNISKMLNQRGTLMDTIAQQQLAVHSLMNNNNHHTRRPINIFSKWYKYQSKMFGFRQLSSQIDIWIKIMKYLDLKDINNMKLVCRQWYQLASIPAARKELRLNGLSIPDVQIFFAHITNDQFVKSLDFSGIIHHQQENDNSGDFWKKLGSVLPKMKKIEMMKFDTVPVSILDNLPSQLKHLKVKNLIESSHEPCQLDFFKKLKSLEMLESLHIDSNNGFILEQTPSGSENNRDEKFQSICSVIKKLSSGKLNTFICRSLKDLTRDEHAQLVGSFNSENFLKLSLGSCSNWFDEPCDLLFDNLSKLVSIRTLNLQDINLVSTSMPLVNLFESLIVVENLSMENLTINTSAKLVWDSFSAILQSLPLKEVYFTSNDPFSNFQIFEALIQLILTQKRSIRVRWLVSVKINNFGSCYVPFSLNPFRCPEQNGEQENSGELRTNATTNRSSYLEKELSKFDTILQYQIDDDQIVLVEEYSLNQWISKKLRLMAKKHSTLRSSFVIIPQ